MFPASTTLGALLTTVACRGAVDREYTLRHPSSSDSQAASRSKPSLDTLNADVMRLILLELQDDKPSLVALASSCHTLRQSAAPVLFQNCRLRGQRFPEAIRPYVRRIRYRFLPDSTSALQQFQTILEDLPALSAIAFVCAERIPWPVVKGCLTHPGIRSLSFDTIFQRIPAEAYPAEEIVNMPISLSSFSFTTPLWRKDLMWRALRSDPQAELEAALSSEASSLSALVPRLHETAEQLTLPMEATPVLSMSERSWSKLHSLSFHGSYVDVAQMEAFPLFFSKVPRLRNLFMTVHQLRNTVHRRAPILGHRLPGDLFQPASIRLRSLTVAYPDPDDDIFSVDVTDLHQLSLRDWPRYYGNLAYEDSQSTGSPAPILTHAECLSILRRMNMPRLTSLELVYLVDPGFADDELLSYISRAFPRLEHLQLHRYRADREEYVDYEHIAKLLVAARSLRTVRLNLDLHGDHGPYCNFVPTLQSWLAKFRDEIGPSIIGILQDLPLLECCELLYHQVGGSTWTEFRPANGPEPHFIEYHDQDIHMDSELLPLQMRRRYRYGRFTRRSFWDGVE